MLEHARRLGVRTRPKPRGRLRDSPRGFRPTSSTTVPASRLDASLEPAPAIVAPRTISVEPRSGARRDSAPQLVNGRAQRGDLVAELSQLALDGRETFVVRARHIHLDPLVRDLTPRGGGEIRLGLQQAAAQGAARTAPPSDRDGAAGGDQLAGDQQLELLLDLRQRGEARAAAPFAASAHRASARPRSSSTQRMASCSPSSWSAWSRRWRYLTARLPGPLVRRTHPRARQARQRGPDRRLVVLDHGVAVGRLVARQPQRVQRQRVDVGRRPLLLDQTTEHPQLDRVGVHPGSLFALRRARDEAPTKKRCPKR